MLFMKTPKPYGRFFSFVPMPKTQITMLTGRQVMQGFFVIAVAKQ